MNDWKGRPVAPIELQRVLGHHPVTRAYAHRPPQHLARSFESYLASRLRVPCRSWEDVYEFLRRCEYARDRQLFGVDELWLHPEDFERQCAGDCEDHALWAWVQLVRAGIEARFTAGLHDGTGHAWVTMYDRGRPFVFETTMKSPEYRPLNAPAVYEPYWSVSAEPRFYWHGEDHPSGDVPDVVFLE
jgi:hypothetical protein